MPCSTSWRSDPPVLPILHPIYLLFEFCCQNLAWFQNRLRSRRPREPMSMQRNQMNLAPAVYIPLTLTLCSRLAFLVHCCLRTAKNNPLFLWMQRVNSKKAGVCTGVGSSNLQNLALESSLLSVKSAPLRRIRCNGAWHNGVCSLFYSSESYQQQRRKKSFLLEFDRLKSRWVG